jgi:ParB family chromosome partitioning protein
VSLSIAEALTLGTAEQQRTMLERLAKSSWANADDVRGWLVDDKPPVSAAVFPLEEYTGTLTRDLFAGDEETFFDDVEQFHRLQKAAVERTAKMLAQDGAQFVDVITEDFAPWWQYHDAEPGDAWGAVIHHAPGGRVEVRHGLARLPVRESVKQSAEPKAKPAYSSSLLRYMAAHKTLAVQAALLENPRKAKEVAVLQMLNIGDYAGSRVKLALHYGVSALAEAAAKPKALMEIEDATEAALSSLPDDMESRLPLAEQLKQGRDDRAAVYEALKQMPDSELEGLHLLLTTLCFGQGNIDGVDSNPDSLFNRVASDLRVDMAAYWRPDEAFLSRRTLEQLKSIAKDSGALPHLGVLKDYNKKGLVAALVRYFSQIETPQAASWLPEAMTFASVREAAHDSANEQEDEALPEAA